MARPTIDNIRDLGDFATVYKWYLSIDTPPPGVASFPDSDQLNFRCISADLPKLDGQSIEVTLHGHKVKQPGIHNYSGTITLTFVETIDNLITEAFRQWREACYESKTGIQKSNNDVKAVIRLTRLDRQDVEIYSYKLIGCYLETFDPGGTLSDSANDTFKPVCTISYDYFEDSAL